MAEPSDWVVRFAPSIRAGGKVLDLASGSGRHTRLLLRLGYRVTAVDRDVSKLRDLAEETRLEVVEVDLEATAWPFPRGRFDGIVVTNFLYRPLLPRLAEALRPGGVLIYDTFGIGNEAFGKPSNPDFLLREGELRDAYAGRLDLVGYEHVTEQEPRPAVRQRICAVLAHDAPKAPERHSDTRDGPKPEQ